MTFTGPSVARHLEDIAEQHLSAENDDYRCEAVVKEMEHLHEARDREIECSQAEHREDVRSIDDERIGGDGKDRGDGIDRENDI